MNNDEAERCWYCQAVLHPEKEGFGGQGWLDGLRDNGSQPSADGNAPASGGNESSEDVPDWLARIRQREQMENQTQGGPVEKADSGGMDWLRDIAGEMNDQGDSDATTTEEPDAPTPIDSDDSDWLGKLESWKSGSEETPVDTSIPVSDQFADRIPSSPEGKETSMPAQPAVPASDNIDWLNDFKEDADKKEEPVPDQPAEIEQQKTGTIAGEEPGLVTETNPVENLEKTSEAISIPTEEPTAVEPVAAPSAEPDWLMDFQSLDPSKDIASQVIPQNGQAPSVKPPFSGRDMMNWISKDQQPAAAVEKAEDAAVPEDENIEPAALPPWLQALRPNKLKRGSASGKAEAADENPKSPLAGIEGALQGDALHQFYTRPQIYANTLKITPEQESHLQRLQNIAGEARWEAQEPAARRSSNGKLLRIITSLLMIGGVLLSTLTNKTALASPTMYPQAVVQSYDLISAQTSDKPVLIAADFDGSLYGEMKWSSEAILRQLVAQDVPIAYLSTTQVGTTLLQQALGDLTINKPEYITADRTINLGYLAGGTVGLQALAEDPQTTMPLSTNLKPAWEDTPLEGIEKISDFGVLIVITENADTARYWIEQVKPSLGETPLLVVISAQSAPMLQPYFDSGQVNGYIAGQSDGAAYEKLSGSEGTASSHFSTLQVSLLFVAILIFVGGLISLIVRAPSPESTGPEKK